VNKVRLFDIFDTELLTKTKEINLRVDFGAKLHIFLWKNVVVGREHALPRKADLGFS
jgi:hypothetical protein